MPLTRTEYLEKALIRAENAYRLTKNTHKKRCEVSLTGLHRPAKVTLIYVATYIGRHLQLKVTPHGGTAELLYLDWAGDYTPPVTDLKT